MADSPSVGTLSSIDSREYREVLTRFATGVTVVTTLEETDEGPQPWGTTVNSFTGISLDPPLVMVSIGQERSIHPIIERIGKFGVNILGEDSQALSDCFAGAPSSLPREAFCEADYSLGQTGLPVLESAIAYLCCELDRVIQAGDHTMYLGRVVETGCRNETGWPLLYFGRRYLSIERATAPDLRGKPDSLR
ncbi:MAG TPA: flavin reductase family protein [Candidatus Limnocylindrales bacterium]|nr:flavin reductase family protein [Candidatus Limnocylindrales bacterium]